MRPFHGAFQGLVDFRQGVSTLGSCLSGGGLGALTSWLDGVGCDACRAR